MPMALYSVPLEEAGALWIMPCPGRETQFADLKAAGADTVVSMLPIAEAQELGMGQEEMFCARHGLTFERHAIADFGLPDAGTFTPFVADLASRIAGGARIVVHCRAGIGRSGMVAACVLVCLGQSATAAISKVRTARGVSIPDTVEQGEFIAEFARTG